MAEKENTIKVNCLQFRAEELKEELRKVRALIVFMLHDSPDVDHKDLANALYVLQYLTEDAQVIDEE